MRTPGWKFHTRSRSKDKEKKPFSHEETYGASFETLERLCFREWPEIDSVGDVVSGGKSAMFTFATSHDFEQVEMSVGKITIAIEE